MGSGMNCGYACGIAGILKILTVVFTAVPTGIMFHVTGNATYYTKENTEKTCKTFGQSAGASNSNKNIPCPPKWLGFMALSIFAICCIISLVCLIILLLVKLNENGIFKQIDFIYHLVAGVAVLLAGCFAISFGALTVSDHRCDTGSEKVDEWCKSLRKYYYEPELQLAAGVIGIIAGIIYILTAFKVKKD